MVSAGLPWPRYLSGRETHDNPNNKGRHALFVSGWKAL